MRDVVNEERLAIGQRIRDLRSDAGWTQGQLAQALGLSFQQIQKYEHGVTRISVVNLLRILAILGVPADLFFADLAEPKGLPLPKPIVDPGLEQLKRDYEHIQDPEARRVLRETARVLCGQPELKRSL